MKTTKNKTIGIFDSGIGGLTVFKEVHKMCPTADIVYLGDTARLPYGTKSPDTISKYLLQNVEFLLKKGVDSVIVACNSASTILDRIHLDIPLQGVILAGSNKAIEQSQSQVIGVMGTRATIDAKSYIKALTTINPKVSVFQQACPLLVPIVEEAMINDAITIELIKRYSAPLLEQGVDTIILGCTHYPILKDMIQMVVGPKIKLVDSAKSIGQIYAQQSFSGSGQHTFYLSDTSDSFINFAKYILEKKHLTVEHVNI